MTFNMKGEKHILQENDDPLRIRIDFSPGRDSSYTMSEGSDMATTGRSIKRPRREEAALFLEKTYELLAHCPPELASWTTNGDSFVVKQPTVFAEHVIPTYFKHRKFSSFVRQLNLYGFRKVRAASATQDETETGAEPEAAAAAEDLSPKDWWEFRHERFVRGRRDLLCEIRRRLPSDAKASTPPLGTTGTPVDRVELDELRAEVEGLREEMRKMQTTNQQLTGMLQTLLQRSGREVNEEEKSRNRLEFPRTAGYSDSPSIAQCQSKVLPSIVLPSATASATGPQLALLQLRQGHQPIGTPRDIRTPRTPASGSFQLRPVQTLMMNVSPNSRPSPRSNHAYVTTSSYNRQQREQLNGNEQRWYDSTSVTRSRSPLKRLRVDLAAPSTEPQTGYSTNSPEDVAVRALSRIATEIRTDLLACITARLTGFLRVHRDQTEPTCEADVDTVGEAVGSDIQLKLTLLQASTAANPMLLDLETTCMYRVEILKFISRELPRAVQEAEEEATGKTQAALIKRPVFASVVSAKGTEGTRTSDARGNCCRCFRTSLIQSDACCKVTCMQE